MAAEEKQANILKFKKKKQLNIGIIIFGIIFIYLIATVVMYLTAPHITVYEVRQGSILKDTAYTGLAIRDEVVVNAAESGYINFYAPNSSKVKVGSNVFTLSADKLNFDETANTQANTLSSEEERAIFFKIQQFVYDYNDSHFAESYYFKSDVQQELSSFQNQSKLSQLNDMLSQGTVSGVKVFQTMDDGVVVYSVDGMEGLTVDSVNATHLDKSNYHKTEYTNNAKIEAGDAVYKIITSETWTLVLDLDAETAGILKDKEYVKANFTKDNQKVWAKLQLKEEDGHHLAYLTFDNSMIRYATERFLDVELILEDETGLKIPKSAETKKEFYVVPTSYITSGGNSSSDGVMKATRDKNGNTVTAFTPVTVYYTDEEEQLAYLDPNEFEKNDVLIKVESSDTYTLNEKRTLKGVYCINKGYAVFKQINILCESDTYYIVEEGSSYGLSNYDHIALDSSKLKENDVVF